MLTAPSPDATVNPGFRETVGGLIFASEPTFVRPVVLEQCTQQSFAGKTALGQGLDVKPGRGQAVGRWVTERIHGQRPTVETVACCLGRSFVKRRREWNRADHDEGLKSFLASDPILFVGSPNHQLDVRERQEKRVVRLMRAPTFSMRARLEDIGLGGRESDRGGGWGSEKPGERREKKRRREKRLGKRKERETRRWCSGVIFSSKQSDRPGTTWAAWRDRGRRGRRKQQSWGQAQHVSISKHHNRTSERRAAVAPASSDGIVVEGWRAAR